MKIITAPEEYQKDTHDICCFLAGGISNCHDWQNDVIETLKDAEQNGIDLSRLVIFNPRREIFINSPDFAEEQIDWEFRMLNISDIFSMYFCSGESVQPICMYELGRNVHRMMVLYNSANTRIIISVEDGYKRAEDVRLQMKMACSCLKINTNATPKSHAELIINYYRNLVSWYGY